MRRIRSTGTQPEMVVRRLAHGLGFRYRLHVKDLPGKPDLVFPRLGRIIEVRGCFWHQHPSARCLDARVPKSRLEYWQPKLARNQERDARNLQALRAAGWRVLVIWECEVRRLDQLERRVRRFLT